MQSSMIKFGFRIRTRTGSVVESLAIYGRDAEDAERKLRQMYHGCEVLECRPQTGVVAMRQAPTNYEDVMNLITAI